MQAHDRTNEYSPENPRPAADRVKEDADDHGRDDVPIAEPEMEFVLAKIGGIGEKFGAIAMHGAAGDNPAHVRPDTAIARRMRVAFLVRVLMMNTMRGYPGNGAAFDGQRAAGGEEVFDQLWRFVAAVREQTMVAHADAEAASDPPHDDGENNCLPGDEENGSEGGRVQGQHEEGDAPIDRLVKGAVALEEQGEAHSQVFTVAFNGADAPENREVVALVLTCRKK